MFSLPPRGFMETVYYYTMFSNKERKGKKKGMEKKGREKNEREGKKINFLFLGR